MEPKYTLTEIMNMIGAFECGVPVSLYKKIIDERCESDEEKNKIILPLFTEPYNPEEAKEELNKYLTGTEKKYISYLSGDIKRMWVIDLNECEENDDKSYYNMVIDIPTIPDIHKPQPEAENN